MVAMVPVLIALIVFTVAALPAVSPRPALACSCVATQPVRTHFDGAAAVFVGRVLTVERESTSNPFVDLRVLLDVSETWKGVTDPEVTVLTPSQGSACGYGFTAGKSYVVYAHDEGGALQVNSCSRTHAGSPTPDELAAFGQPLPLQGVDGDPAAGEDFPSDTTSALRVAILVGLPIVIAAIGATGVLWWRYVREGRRPLP